MTGREDIAIGRRRWLQGGRGPPGWVQRPNAAPLCAAPSSDRAKPCEAKLLPHCERRVMSLWAVPCRRRSTASEVPRLRFPALKLHPSHLLHAGGYKDPCPLIPQHVARPRTGAPVCILATSAGKVPRVGGAAGPVSSGPHPPNHTSLDMLRRSVAIPVLDQDVVGLLGRILEHSGPARLDLPVEEDPHRLTLLKGITFHLLHHAKRLGNDRIGTRGAAFLRQREQVLACSVFPP
mmetsp:Transcript_13445/g.37199  ORF Transcript_13445/g.37199 Transcript_13445/m.37199 type:complete len:235 (+) Transcript_13445:42-746(+)